MRRVMVCGYFDPLHRGHINHFRLAKQLGDYLIVVISPSWLVAEKKRFPPLQPLPDRIARIKRKCPFVDEVQVSLDTDGTQTKTLEIIRPDVFAKGGDRTPDNMPQGEIDACARLGIHLAYNVGGVLGSSTAIHKRWLRKNKWIS